MKAKLEDVKGMIKIVSKNKLPMNNVLITEKLNVQWRRIISRIWKIPTLSHLITKFVWPHVAVPPTPNGHKFNRISCFVQKK